MAKQTGITATITIDDSGGVARTVSGTIQAFSVNTTRGVFDVTPASKSAMERLLGLSDSTFSITAASHDPASNDLHDVLKTVSTQAGTVTRTVVVGFTTGTATLECVPTGATWTRGADGNLVVSAEFVLANGTALSWA